MNYPRGATRQFSITAEIEHFGAPRVELLAKGRGETYFWTNGESKITGYAGKDLVFVSFELASYAAATARKQERGGPQECR